MTGISVKLGQKIRAARKAFGLTQKELGQKVGVSKQSISRWESGDDMPQGANLLELTTALSLEPGWFAQDGDENTDHVSIAEPTTSESEPAIPPELDHALRSIRADFLAGRLVLQDDAEWRDRIKHIRRQARKLMTWPALPDAVLQAALRRDAAATRVKRVKVKRPGKKAH